jgi:four helix bundle protein
MGKIQSFKELIVWQKSRILVKETYELCAQLPKSELFALSSQMRRSSISISSNIAEGYKRKNRAEFAHFLGIANGSAAELEAQMIATEELFSIDTSRQQELSIEVQRMLSSLRNKISSGK